MWQPTNLKIEESGYNKVSKTPLSVQVIQQKTLIKAENNDKRITSTPSSSNDNSGKTYKTDGHFK